MNNLLLSNPLLGRTLRVSRWPSPRVTLALLVGLWGGSFAARGWLVSHVLPVERGLFLLLLWLLPLITMIVAAVSTARRLRTEAFQVIRQSPLTACQVTSGLGVSTLYYLRAVLVLAFGLLPALVDDTWEGALALVLCLAGLHLAASMLGVALMLRWGHQRLGVVLTAVCCVLVLVLAHVIDTFYPALGSPVGLSPAQLRLSIILLRWGLRGPLLIWIAAVLPALLGGAAGLITWYGEKEERRSQLEMVGMLAVMLALGALTLVAGGGERQALVALYRATGGQSWSHNDGWLSDQPVCSWYGVTCAGGRVVGLQLTENNLIGEMPPEIELLVNLQTVDLSFNQLSKLPPEIGQLASLQTLKLFSNNLTELPPEIGQLTNLQTMDLSLNRLTGLPPEIGQLASLQVLDLSGTNEDPDSNHITQLPPEIGQLFNLQLLDLNGNQLSKLPPEMVHMTSLNQLFLWNNKFTEVPPVIFQITSLKDLALGGNQLLELPPQIGQLRNLERLGLAFNQLMDLPPEIGQLRNLQELALSFNQLMDLPPEVGQLASLRSLDLYANPISRVPPGVCQLPIPNFAASGLCSTAGAEDQEPVSYVDPLPINSPEMAAALPDGTLPCGLGKMGWGLKVFRWDDFPGCRSAFPAVTVYCLDNQGHWTDFQIRMYQGAVSGPRTLTLRSMRDGTCGIFPQH